MASYELFALLIIVNSLQVFTIAKCPVGWSQMFEGSCYLSFAKQFSWSWEDARRHCREKNAEADLLTINSYEEKVHTVKHRYCENPQNFH